MTLVTLPSPIYWPGIVGAGLNMSIGSAATVSSAGHYQAYIFCAKEDMTISHVGFRAGTSTGSPTVEVRIETVDATGLPSGTLWATNTNGTTGTISSNTNVLQALTASASITKGQIFCAMIKYASGTSQVISQTSSYAGPYNSSLPYGVSNTGTPTKALFNGFAASVALGSSSTTFYHVPGCFPLSSTTGGAFNNTNSAKRGLRFTPPMKCRAIGVRWYNSSSAGDFNAVVYDDAGAELSSTSTAFDGDHNAASTNGACSVYFDNTVTLNAGTTYRVAIEPTSATNATVYAVVIPSANYRGATAAGTTAHYTTFATATWTDTATDTLPLMDLIIDQVDDGTGSGASGGGQRVISG